MLLCMTIYIMEPQQNKSSQKNVTHSGKERPNASVKKDEESECCCSLFQINDSRPGSSYLFYEKMDEHNKAATDVLMTKGMDEAVKHMLTRPDGKPRSYAEMRELFG